MKLDSTWRRVAALFAIGAATLLAGCNTPPAFQVSQPSARDEARHARVMRLLGNQIGGGRGQTVATVVGATGGATIGNQAANRSQTIVWRIAIRYDDGSVATVQQSVPPAFRVGDRVRVTPTGIQQL